MPVKKSTASPSGSKTGRRQPSQLRINFARFMEHFGYPTEYVPKECHELVRNYKYSGTNYSLMYQYCLKPIASSCIGITPTTIAPNIITLAGFACTTSTLVIGLYLSSPLWDVPVPAWYAGLSAAAIFVYQTLDNMDGIQARRTGSSSPLGQLFDHGIDSMNASVLISLMGINSANGPFLLYGCLVLTMITFFCTTWEEYATGSFTLGLVNGPDDGLTMCSLLLLVSALCGPSAFWQYKLPVLGWTYGEAMAPLLLLASFCTVAVQLIMTYRWHREGFFYALPALGALILFLVEFGVAAWQQYMHGSAVIVMTFAGGSLFGLMMCRLILAHVCRHRFGVLQREHWLLLPAVLFPGAGTVVACVLGAVSLAHYAVVAIDDLCIILNINAFSLKKK